MLDRIEVMKGPASVLYGNASPGGIVNMISKKPQKIQNTDVEFDTGSDNRREEKSTLPDKLATAMSAIVLSV